MPSLKVACVARIKSRSSISRKRWKVRIVGIVASPTPTVPISSDSISTMSSKGPRCFDSAAAATQPAVPPPAITTRLIVCVSARGGAAVIGSTFAANARASAAR
jgi:hypothetical protein